MRARDVERRVSDGDRALRAASCPLARVRASKSSTLRSRVRSRTHPARAGRARPRPSRSIRACATAGGLPVRSARCSTAATASRAHAARAASGSCRRSRAGERSASENVSHQRGRPASISVSANARRSKRTADVRRCGVARDVGPIGVRSRRRLRARAGSPPRTPRRASGGASRRRRTERARSVGDHRVDTLAQRADVAAERLRPVLGDLDRTRADDDAVRKLGCSTRMLRSRDAEACIERDVRDGTRALDEAGERGGVVGARTRRPRDGDEIEPAVRLLRCDPQLARRSTSARRAGCAGAPGVSPAGRSATIIEVAPAAPASCANRSQPYASRRAA